MKFKEVYILFLFIDKETNSVLLSQSEKAVRDRIRKRGPHHPMTLDMILLRATSSKYGQCDDLARSNMELNARVRDAWGPDSSRETQSSKIHTSGPSFPPTEVTLKKSAPSTTHKHLHHNPQRSRQTSSCSRFPAQLEAKSTKGTPPIHSQRPLKVAIGGMNKITPLNTLSQEDGKSPKRLFVRQTATAPRRYQHISQPPRSVWRAQSLPAENRHTVGGIYSGEDQKTADSHT